MMTGGDSIYAKPILEKYGFDATFFMSCMRINGDLAAEYGGVTKNDLMNWSQVISLYNDGFDIQSHGMTHRDLTQLSKGQLEYEIAQSKVSYESWN